MDADDEARFRDFVVGRWHTLLRTAYLLTGDHHAAEDLVQSALVSCHRRWAAIERSDAPEVYVRQAMVHQQTSWWRGRKLGDTPVPTLPEPPPGDPAAEVDRRDELWRAVLTLPPRMRAVLVLRYFEDLPEAEVAQVLGCSVGSVKSQTSRGLDRLRDLLTTEDAPAAQGSRP